MGKEKKGEGSEVWFCYEAPEEIHVWTRKHPWTDRHFGDRGVSLLMAFLTANFSSNDQVFVSYENTDG